MFRRFIVLHVQSFLYKQGELGMLEEEFQNIDEADATDTGAEWRWRRGSAVSTIGSSKNARIGPVGEIDLKMRKYEKLPLCEHRLRLSPKPSSALGQGLFNYVWNWQSVRPQDETFISHEDGFVCCTDYATSTRLKILHRRKKFPRATPLGELLLQDQAEVEYSSWLLNKLRTVTLISCLLLSLTLVGTANALPVASSGISGVASMSVFSFIPTLVIGIFLGRLMALTVQHCGRDGFPRLGLVLFVLLLPIIGCHSWSDLAGGQEITVAAFSLIILGIMIGALPAVLRSSCSCGGKGCKACGGGPSTGTDD